MLEVGPQTLSSIVQMHSNHTVYRTYHMVPTSRLPLRCSGVVANPESGR